MSILIVATGKNVENWVTAIKKQDPTLPVIVYPENHDPEKIEYAISWKHPRGLYKNYPNLKVVASMGAGVDHITSDPAISKTTIITRIVDEQLTADMSSFVLALIMEKIRNIGLHHYQNSWQPQSYTRISDTRVGIMGLGVLGGEVAQSLKKNGFDVSGWSRTPSELKGIQTFSSKEQLNDFLKDLDILVCLLPLTRETENILNKELFENLKKGAYLINVARGEHLVEHDLLEMIDKGHISGASLDVFRTEPLPEEHAFWKHPGIKITPHVASMTNPDTATAQIIDNYHRMKRNQLLQNVVEKQKGY